MKKIQLQNLWRSLLCGVTVAAFCVAAPTVSAQDGWDEEEEAATEEEGSIIEEISWETRKQEMENKRNAEINKRREQVRQILTLERVANQVENLVYRRYKELPTDIGRKRDGKGGFVSAPRGSEALGDFSLLRIPGISLNWKNFNRTPPKSLDALVSQIEIDAEEAAEEAIHPEDQKRAIREQAEERFKMVRINERVSLILRGGRGAAAIIDNQPYRSATDEYVQLGNRTIIKEDLDLEDQAKFYPDVNEELKAAYITNRCGQVDVEVESRIDAYIYENTAKSFRDNYYVPDITKPTASLRTAKPEFWIPMKTFVEKVRNTLIERQVIDFEALELPKWMQENGYFLVDKEDGSGKEWVDEIEKLRREMPAPTQMDPNGMDPMGMPGGMPPGMGMPPAGMR